MNRAVYSGAVLRPLERLFVLGTFSGLSEGELLARFVNDRDDSAFGAIVARHGPMVMGICRRLLNHSQDVEDAFQSTFLVLVKKARSLRDCELLGNWLYGVAVRVAMRLRRDQLRRRSRERTVCADTATFRDSDGEHRELRLVLDAEVERLPYKFRMPIILCYFDGMTHDQAAERLECPVGTIRSRMAKGRELLRSRLSRRGVVPTPLFMSMLRAPDWHVSAELLARTVAAATRVAAGQSITAGVISTSTATLALGAIKTMPLTKVIKVAAIFVAIGAAGGGAGLAARQLGAERAGESARNVSSQEPIEKAIQALEEARNQIKHDRDRLAGTEAEIKAMRKELENLREVIRPLAIGGMFMKRDEIKERLKPVAAASDPFSDEKTTVKTPSGGQGVGTGHVSEPLPKAESDRDSSTAGTAARNPNDPFARNQAEMKAMRKDIENLKEVIRSHTIGGGAVSGEEIKEKLKPAAPEVGRARR